MSLSQGRIEPIERVRTKKKAHDRLIEMVVDRVKGKDNIRLATLHANAAEDAKTLTQRILNEVEPVEIVHSEVSPVVGAHVGPGTIGVAYITD